MIAGLLIAVVVAGGAWGAEHSNPGDLLYPVKVNVNEHIVSAFAVSDESEAKWQMHLAERRMIEAETLASEGALTNEIIEEIRENFKKHEEKMNAHAEKLAVEERAEVLSGHESALEAHSHIIANLSSNTEAGTSEHLKGLIEDVGHSLEATLKAREEHEEKVVSVNLHNNQNAANGIKKAASNKIEEVKKFIAGHQEYLSAEAKIKVDEKIAIADKEFTEANAKLELGAYGDAFNAFHEAMRTAQETKILVESSTMPNFKLEEEDFKNDHEDRANVHGTTTARTTAESDKKKEGHDSASSGIKAGDGNDAHQNVEIEVRPVNSNGTHN